MTSHEAPVRQPEQSSTSDGRTAPPGFRVPRHAWTVGGALAIATLAGYWWRQRRRRKRVELEPVSEQWLSEHLYEAGQRGDEG
jgi:hypothetical protein